MNKHKAGVRAEEIIRRILNTGKPLAVFVGSADVLAVGVETDRFNMLLAKGQALIGVYDEACPVHWLAADIEGA